MEEHTAHSALEELHTAVESADCSFPYIVLPVVVVVVDLPFPFPVVDLPSAQVLDSDQQEQHLLEEEAHIEKEWVTSEVASSFYLE